MKWWQDFDPAGKSREDLEDYVVYKLVQYANSERKGWGRFRFPSVELRKKTVLEWYNKDFYRWTDKHWDSVDPFFEELMNNGADYAFIPRVNSLPNSPYLGDWINQLIWAYKDIYESFSRPWTPLVSRAPDPLVSRAPDPLVSRALDPPISCAPYSPVSHALDPQISRALDPPVARAATTESTVNLVAHTAADSLVPIVPSAAESPIVDSHVPEASGSTKSLAPETYIDNMGPQVRKTLKSVKTLTPEISLELPLPLCLRGTFKPLILRPYTWIPVQDRYADTTSSRGKVRKDVSPQEQYVAQRALGAYIASVSQPEASFDLSFAAQITNPEKDNIKSLNKRLQWQLDNAERRLRFVRLDLDSLRLVIFADSFFANNKDFSSQIGFVIVLADGANNANIVHWSSIKCKRVTRSVLASELYAMVHGFDSAASIKSTTTQLLHLTKPLPLVFCTDSKSLYECLVKLGTTQEKRLMIDLMCLRQSYERQEIAEIKWIDGESNPADAMTKSKPCRALQALIDTNKLNINVDGWVERSTTPPTKATPIPSLCQSCTARRPIPIS
ncbi:hypothetical protein TSTA_097080 [Talaromyces stipitatus ATCC 10500]|uniref:Uncharacterized protein n=1 Tax=Talaromyces stipitatus (strain ATCC 10500 / CBS 375.48 / QM 6759 / NRRL 1006) TaxID=441959 RepID=B8LZN6_TALSN|nr:uncharacterized protein TSTA_097080 [Talaromyces stipitatus ATCC 10500]EED22459.1 hypothetical protein TSTA_097080 [Talaromyces stipitatus ATCC 10500]